MPRIVSLMRIKDLLIWLALSLFPIAWSANAATLEIIPPAPRYLEPVYLRWSPDIGSATWSGAQVKMEGNVITVDIQGLPGVAGVYPFDIELGVFPAGTYTVRVTAGGPQTSFTVSPQTIGAFNVKVPTVNFSGHWSDPSESGWGMSIEQGPTNVLYAVWFVYGPQGEPTWYTFQGNRWIPTYSRANAGIEGPIYQYTGPYIGGPFDSAKVGASLVGTGTLRFSNYNTGFFTYKLDGVIDYTSKNISRLIIE